MLLLHGWMATRLNHLHQSCNVKVCYCSELWSLMHAIMNFDVATLLKVDRGLKIQKRKSNKLDCKKVWDNIHHWSQHWKQWKCHFRVQSTRGDAQGFEILSRFRLHPWLQHIIIYYTCMWSCTLITWSCTKFYIK